MKTDQIPKFHSLSLLLLAMAGLCMAGSARANTITVTSLADDGSAGTLRKGIEATGSGGTINFQASLFSTGPGTITLTQGELTIGRNMAIVGPGATTLSISGNNSSPVFNIQSGATVTISGLTITGGVTNGAPGGDPNGDGATAQGGGIFNAGTLTLKNCLIQNSSATGGGGESYALGSSGGGEGAGGGIYNSWILILINCTLANNSATGGNAGSLDSQSTGSYNGGGGAGGGIYNSRTLMLTNCTLANNNATGGSKSSYTLGESRNGGYVGDGDGGGICSSAYFILSSCTLSQNSSTGGSVDQPSDSEPTGGNANGGGIYCLNAPPPLLQNSIIAGNHVVPGTIISGSGNPGTPTAPDVNGTVTSGGFNLIGYVDGSSGWTGSDQFGGSSYGGELDPVLGPLQNNGGPTPTMALALISAAVGQGNCFGMHTDQRGYKRPSLYPQATIPAGGDGSDIGAYEAQMPMLLVPTWALPGGLLNIKTAPGSSPAPPPPTNAFPPFGMQTMPVGGLSATGQQWTAFTGPLRYYNGNNQYAARDQVSGGPGALYRLVYPATNVYFIQPAVTTPATAITSNSAVLHGNSTPYGFDTIYWFEYGSNINYGWNTATNSLATSTNLASLSWPLQGLIGLNTYHFQLAVQDDDGTQFGGDQQFTTLGWPPGACTNGCIQFVGASNLVFSACSCVPVFYPVSAYDTCCSNGTVLLTFSPTNGSCFAPGTTTAVNCTATSSCNHCNSTNFTVTVLQNTNPPVINCPSNLVVTSCAATQVNYTVTASSAFCGNVPVVCTPPSGSLFAPGTTTVCCEATDCCGNSNSCCFTVTVNPNTTPPVVNCPSNIVVGTACSGTVVIYSATASSVYCSNVTVVVNPPSGSFFALGTNTVNCVATDCCGNSNTCSFTVTVNQTTNNGAGVIWTAQDSGSNFWRSIASSSDGSHLVAAPYPGFIHTSTNYGVTWTAQQSSGSNSWNSVVSSSDGSHLAAAVEPGLGHIYTSTNYGVTWTEQNSGGRHWWALASSADGSDLAAVVFGGYIYTSTNYGVTWTQQNSGSNIWHAIASSADGSHLVAAVSGGYIYTSTDFGVTWTQQNSGTNTWNSLASSADGSHLVVTVPDRQIYTSTNYGVAWTAQNSGNQEWESVASSGDGSRLVAVVQGGSIYTSGDYGVTWTAQNSGVKDWYSVASSADGCNLVAGVGDNAVGQIYTSACTPADCCVPPPSGLAYWWPGEGNALDIFAGNNGTLQGGVTYTNGEVGQAFNLNGSNAFISTSLLITNPQTFSLTLWFRTAATNGGVLISFDSSQTNVAKGSEIDRNIYLDDTGALYFGVWNAGPQQINSAAGYNDNHWHWVVGSLSASTGLSLYVDGVLAGNNAAVTNASTIYNGYWRFGEDNLDNWPYQPASYYFQGQIDEVAIFNTALSSNSVAAIYGAGSAGMCPP